MGELLTMRIDDMEFPQLLAVAKSLGIDVPESTTPAQLKRMLKSHYRKKKEKKQ